MFSLPNRNKVSTNVSNLLFSFKTIEFQVLRVNFPFQITRYQLQARFYHIKSPDSSSSSPLHPFPNHKIPSSVYILLPHHIILNPCRFAYGKSYISNFTWIYSSIPCWINANSGLVSGAL